MRSTTLLSFRFEACDLCDVSLVLRCLILERTPEWRADTAVGVENVRLVWNANVSKDKQWLPSSWPRGDLAKLLKFPLQEPPICGQGCVGSAVEVPADPR